LLDAAERAGIEAMFVEEQSIRIPNALEAARKTLGSPWQKDHKLAATAALVALGQ